MLEMQPKYEIGYQFFRAGTVRRAVERHIVINGLTYSNKTEVRAAEATLWRVVGYWVGEDENLQYRLSSESTSTILSAEAIDGNNFLNAEDAIEGANALFTKDLEPQNDYPLKQARRTVTISADWAERVLKVAEESTSEFAPQLVQHISKAIK